MKRKECEGCLLYNSTEVANWGSIDSDVVFVGESPGRDEVIAGHAFVGKAGKRLRQTLSEAGIENYSLINSAKCLINKKELTDSKAKKVLKHCRPNAEKILHKIKPKLIVCLGNYAMYQIIGMAGIEKRKGGFYRSDEFDCDVFVMNHPAATLYDPSKIPQFQKHVQTVASYINNDFAIPDPVKGKYLAVSSIQFLLDKKDITVSFDTECQGMEWTDKNAPVLCYSVSDEKGVGYTIWLNAEVPVEKADYTFVYPRASKKGKRLTYKDEEIGVKRFPEFGRRIKELKELMARKDIKKIMMNGNFDLLMLYKLFDYKEYEINSYTLDIQAAAHVLDENTYALADLGRLTSDFTDIPTGKKEMYRRDMIMSDLLAADHHEVTAYSASDADDTLQTGLSVRKQLLSHPRQANYYINLVQPALVNVLYPLERNGVLLDMEKLPGVEADVKQQMLDYQQECIDIIRRTKPRIITKYKDTGKGMVLTRRDIIRDYLFDKRIGFGLKPISYTKAGAACAGKDDLKLLQDKQNDSDVMYFLDRYTKYSEMHTFYTRYLSGLRKFVKADGRLHSKYTCALSNTGRVSTSQPNSQNFPKRSKQAKMIRRLLIAPDGWDIVAADYSQCLVPETELITIDGIKQLREVIAYKIPVLTCTSTDEISFQSVKNGWCSGIKQIYRVHLQDGSFVDCSALHRFRLHGSSNYVMVKDMAIGDRLAHIYDGPGNQRYYAQWNTYNPETQHMVYFRKHRLVGDYVARQKGMDKFVCHHKDGDKSNWIRSNLDICESNSEHIKKYHAQGVSNNNYGNRDGRYVTCPVCGTVRYRCPSQNYVTCSTTCANIYFEKGKWNTGCVPWNKGKKLNGRNHKVIRIEKLGKRKTYQIEVDKIHNYVLANGLISKNSELRWISHVAQDPVMLDIFRNDGDIHTTTAEKIIGKPMSELSKEDQNAARRSAKGVNFGFIYGMFPKRFQVYMHTDYGISITLAQAEKYRNDFFSLYPRLLSWHRRAESFAIRHKYVDSPFGRRRHLPMIDSNDPMIVSLAKRQAINAPIQSVSSDCGLLAGSGIKRKGLLDPDKSAIALFTHDELAYYVREDYAEYARDVIVHEMENLPFHRFGFEMTVPLKADCKKGKNLAEMEDF